MSGIYVKDLIKVYHDPETDVRVSALRGLDLFVKEGEVASIIGPSGAGKSTLIKILCGLETASGGSVYIGDTNIVDLSEKEMQIFRFKNIGIINQFVAQNLIPNLTVEQNILLPLKMRYASRQRARKELDELLSTLNIERIRYNPVTKISGGEAVRTSIGVTLAKKPKIILADEPTGQLDTANTNNIIETFKDLNRAFNTTILVVTHDLRFRNAFNKSYIIRDGRLVGVNVEMDRSELDFLVKPQESTLQSVIDSSQFVRLPDEVYQTGEFKHIVEFDIHPSKKFSILFNPNNVTKKEIYELLPKTHEYSDIEEKIEEEEEEHKVSFDEVRPIMEQEFLADLSDRNIIEVRNLVKSFPLGKRTHEVLKGISFNIQKGDFVVIAGKSGAGKTTLMNVVSGVEKPTSGEIIIDGINISEESGSTISNMRFKDIAMISQVNNLFSQYTVKENMEIPEIFNGIKDFYSQIDFLEIAEECKIDHRLNQYPPELSAGEKQRAALAVALSRHTPVIFADEPTANLDSRLARNIISMLMETARVYNTTIMMSTHDLSLVRPGFRLIRLQDGKIIEDVRVTKNKLKGILENYLDIKIEENGSISY
ncbi:MAG: ATP-binding cassette domain-containing protein [Candidatus Heimdallarchaeum endolithica]|uniref:ATP-binding cassette domain-containing protein n=1 Tax=Candidatus Heimdallarchaeum endolithica TaxID=2876572 RepID=A0A9Y1BRC2_9ARCH|nr:MAG: ATP-binding cassette domain-containing protein [Candidatus Heimdallarchaeum endolithica]